MDESTLEFLSRFCAWFGQVVSPANEFRIAMRSGDEARINDARILLMGATDRFANEYSAASDFASKEDEWWFASNAWNHAGKHGCEPAAPEWPSMIPPFREVLEIVTSVTTLRYYVPSWIENRNPPKWPPGVDRPPLSPLEEFPYTQALRHLINGLNQLLSLIEIEKERGRDGPIDRNALARLASVSPKTLANRASELPAPIARTSKDVPIYLYQPAKHALKAMYPERAGTLPETYQEAVSRTE